MSDTKEETTPCFFRTAVSVPRWTALRITQAERRGDLKAARAWLDIAERCLRFDAKRAVAQMFDERRRQWRAEQPHRLKAIEHYAHFPRGC